MRLLLLLALCLVCRCEDCPRFMCAPSEIQLLPDVCVYNYTFPQGFAYLLQECMDPLFSFCAFDSSEGMNSTCQVPPGEPPIPKEKSAAGEPCTFDFDCWGETICDQGKCSNPGVNCTGDEACDIGFYCDLTHGVCSPQVVKGGDCEPEPPFMCQNNYGCNNTVCLPYMSVAPGQPVSTCVGNVNYLCQYLFCYSEGNQAFCMGNATSATGAPMSCEKGNCLAKGYTSAQITGECQCAYGTSGIPYCSLFPGDYPMSMYVQSVQKWINSPEISKCNTARRFLPACMSVYMPESDYLTFNYYYQYAYSFPQLQDMDQCGDTIFLQEYFQAKQAYEEYYTPNKTEPSGAQVLAAVAAWMAIV